MKRQENFLLKICPTFTLNEQYLPFTYKIGNKLIHLGNACAWLSSFCRILVQ